MKCSVIKTNPRPWGCHGTREELLAWLLKLDCEMIAEAYERKAIPRPKLKYIKI